MAIAVSALKQQIEKAKESLKSVDDNIKKMTGRDPNELRPDRGRGSRGRGINRLGRRLYSEPSDSSAEPPAKRAGNIFRRVGSSGQRRKVVTGSKPSQPSDEEEDEDSVKPAVHSEVVSTAKSLSKTDVISAQNVGEKGKARNRRMFGVLMGTLARFQNDQSKADLALKQEQRRSEIERRLEAEQATDRRRAAAERRELFSERRCKQIKINLLEEKVELAAQFAEWEAEWKKKSPFLVTKTLPAVFFLPKDSTARTTRALSDTQHFIKEKMEIARASLEKTLKEIDAEIDSLDAVKNKQGQQQGVTKDSSEGGKKVEGDEIDDLNEEPTVDINVDVDEGRGKGDEGVEDDRMEGDKIGDAGVRDMGAGDDVPKKEPVSDSEFLNQDSENGKIPVTENSPGRKENFEDGLANGVRDDKVGLEGNDSDGKCVGNVNAGEAEESMISEDNFNQGFGGSEKDQEDSGDVAAVNESTADVEEKLDAYEGEDAVDNDQKDEEGEAEHITEDIEEQNLQPDQEENKDVEEETNANESEDSNEVQIVETTAKNKVTEVVEILSSPSPQPAKEDSNKKRRERESRSERHRKDSQRSKSRRSRSRSRNRRSRHQSRRSRSLERSKSSSHRRRSERRPERRKRSPSSGSSSSDSDTQQRSLPRKSKINDKHRRRRSSSSRSSSRSSSSSRSPPRRRRRSPERKRRSRSRRRSRSGGRRR